MEKRALRALRFVNNPFVNLTLNWLDPGVMSVQNQMLVEWMKDAGGWVVEGQSATQGPSVGGKPVGDMWWGVARDTNAPTGLVIGTPGQVPIDFIDQGIRPLYGPRGGSAIATGPGTLIGGNYRFTYRFVARREINSSFPRVTYIPQYYYRPGTWHQFDYTPAIDPHGLPPGHAPRVHPPIPYRLIPARRHNPYRVDQSGGSQPSRPVPLPAYIPGRLIPAREIVVTPPNVRPEPNAPGKPPVWTDGVHSQRPPRRRERERKLAGALPVPVEALISMLTEAGDLLNAFFDSLPQEVRNQYRWKGGDPIDRFEFVVANLDKIDLIDLVKNIGLMLAEDAVIGALGKAQAKQYRKLYETLGAELAGRLPKFYALPRY